MIGLVMVAALFGMAQDAAPTALPEWMSGAWCTDGPRTDRTCEYWTPDSGGMMLGMSITTKGGKAAEYEQLRIARIDGRPVYYASPQGKPETAFRAAAGDGASIMFTRDGPDYPQRIRYWREGERLVAEIAAYDGTGALHWRYSRVP